MRVVFDTNIYISAFVIPGGNAEKAYLCAINGFFELYTSVAILTGLARKLADKFDWENFKVVDLINHISSISTVLKTDPSTKVLSDDPDNRILECIVEADADFLVTGDKHLLNLKNYKRSKIIRLSDFLGMLDIH